MPSKTRRHRRQDLLNESLIMVLMYHMLIFSDFNGNIDSQFMFGYSFLALVAFGIIANLYCIVIVGQVGRLRQTFFKESPLSRFGSAEIKVEVDGDLVVRTLGET